MFKKFITICLVISTLGYGVAWAGDIHLDAPQARGDVSFGEPSGNDFPAPGGLDHGGCDHCCHASAHLVGIASAGTSTLSAVRGSACSAYTASMISFLDIPSLPPPR